MKTLSKKQWGLLALLSIVILFIRFWALLEKPLHHDESINAWFIMQMWQLGYFKYDPTNYHGPLLFYFLQLSEIFFGDGIWSVRAVPNIFSWLTVVFFLWRGLRDHRVWWLAAGVLTFSPAMEFFGRSGIHEAILVFSYLMALWALEQAFEKLEKKHIYLFIGAFAAAAALKETVVVFAIPIIIAALVFRPWSLQDLLAKRTAWGKALLVALSFLFFLYTGFLQHLSGALDFFVAYLPWLKTGVHGSGHEKSFFYWLQLMFQNEIPSLLLASVPIFGWKWMGRKVRFFAVLGWLHFLIYSLIPYKTPWCLISIQLPLVFAGTLATIELVQKTRRQVWIAIGVATLVPLPHLWQLCFQHPLNLNHPYVYVQTQYSFKRVIEYLELNRDLIGAKEILVTTAEFWPLPWWLRKFQVGFRSTAATEDGHDIVIADAATLGAWKEKFGDRYFYHEFPTRDSREPAVLLIKNELHEKMVGDL